MYIEIDLRDIKIELAELKSNSGPDYNKANWEQFTNKLEQLELELANDTNLSNEEINNFLDKLKVEILEAANEAIPKHKFGNATDKYINNKIKKIKTLKNKLERKYKKLRTLYGKHYYITKQVVRELNKSKYKKEITKSESDYWSNRIKKEWQ